MNCYNYHHQALFPRNRAYLQGLHFQVLTGLSYVLQTNIKKLIPLCDERSEVTLLPDEGDNVPDEGNLYCAFTETILRQ